MECARNYDCLFCPDRNSSFCPFEEEEDQDEEYKEY